MVGELCQAQTASAWRRRPLDFDDVDPMETCEVVNNLTEIKDYIEGLIDKRIIVPSFRRNKNMNGAEAVHGKANIQ